MPTPLETYLTEIRRIRASGAATDELTYYSPLQNLLNTLGKSLRPKVFCLGPLKDQGAGHPDLGLFTAQQISKASLKDPVPSQLPERGAVEVKALDEEVEAIVATEQFDKYWRRYGLVLVTNYRAFKLVGRNEYGQTAELEHFELADNADAFWGLAAKPRVSADRLALRLEEFLKRVLLYKATLTQPKDVAWFLASYARDALARSEEAGEIPALDLVRTTLEEALGMTFEGDKGRHFFLSTLVQTLFYGLFSAWVLWCKQHADNIEARKAFDHRSAHWHLRLPVLRTLFEQLDSPGKLGPLKLDELMDWATLTLRRVDDKAFFARFQEDHAVQYFYEPFLEAFDPVLRKALGVRYTPPEVVEYMVERIDRVLREELEVTDGFADPKVYVLDPCCGTGSYLVAVLKRIERTLREKGDDALVGADVKRAALERVFGFEILPAPFVVAHLQLSLLLEGLGALAQKPLYPEEENYERPSVYLTNALTGWEAPKGQQRYAPLPDVTDEIRLAGKVKRETPILVVLGNPPYNAFAGVSPREEQGLVEVYKKGLISKWGIKKFNLDDLYVRFFRMAERRIAEMTGQGVVCYISNFSYLGNPSFVVMRERFVSEFDKLWFDCLNGDSRETGKLTPNGKPDPSIFSTEHNREGIRVGTAIGLMVRKAERDPAPTVRFRHFWGVRKREELVESLDSPGFDSQYEEIFPEQHNRFSFRRLKVNAQYMAWPKLTELCGVDPINGLMEKRGGALIDIERSRLEHRMRRYHDPGTDWDAWKILNLGLTRNTARFDAQKTRSKVIERESFDPDRLKRYALRPFDNRWCYYSPVRPLWNEPRPALWAQCRHGNAFLITRPAGVASPEGAPLFFTRLLGDNDFLRGHAYYFPLRLRPSSSKKGGATGQAGFLEHDTPEEIPGSANLSEQARLYLAKLGIGNPEKDADTADLIWMHALAIGYAPAYLSENADGVRQDWPRVPLPARRETLLKSAELGRQIAALLDPETPVEGVTSGGTIRPELKSVGPICRAGGGGLGERDLRLTARWGYAGKNRVTMPGPGDARLRDYSQDERAAIGDGAAALGLTTEEALACLGEATYDIYLNEVAYWSNVPERVWRYTIGGYQVIKKWLSYREHDLLGRPLATDEARYVTEMARRIAAILLIEPRLDANYRTVCEDACPWPETH